MVGAAPSFSDVHLLRALLVLDRKPTGRKRLVRVLGVGEGSVRTILKRLDEEKLIVSSRRGQHLSKGGEKFLAEMMRKFTPPGEIGVDWLNGNKSFVIVHNAANKVGTGVVERDVAFRAGADGAVILKFVKGKLSFPAGIPIKDYGNVKNGAGDLRENDVVVISFAKTQSLAEDGALAIAMRLSQ